VPTPAASVDAAQASNAIRRGKRYGLLWEAEGWVTRRAGMEGTLTVK
jgi:hypothetical protein